MITYDYIITGLGCAGMSLLHYLLESPLKSKNILVIDSCSKNTNDRTWCYWAEKPLEIHPKNAPLIFWDEINIFNEGKAVRKKLGKLKYFHIKSSDFYSQTLEKIRNTQNITFIKDNVSEITELNGTSVQVKTKSNGSFSSGKVFNSIPSLQVQENSQYALKQIFLGWKIKTDQPFFDTGAATLMHFNSKKNSLTDFFYILPYKENEALIEYTLFSKKSCSVEEMEIEIKSFIKEDLKIEDYEISFEEKGCIPMTTQINIESKSNKIIPIGTLSGCSKPSTGYTFYDIQKHSQQIVNKLVKEHAPSVFSWKRKIRFTFYDNILLNIAVKWPHAMPAIFSELFSKNSAASILKFLNEETSLLEEIRILSRLSFPIFIKSLIQYEKH
jgi:lycopene beta-cyclase